MGLYRSVILAAVIGASAPLAAAAPAYELSMEGYVPVVCRATVEAGRLKEFCNNAAGYQVWLGHAPGTEGAVIVDGVKKPLSADGRTLVSQSATAAVHTRSFEIEGAAGAVSLSVSPL